MSEEREEEVRVIKRVIMRSIKDKEEELREQ